MTRIFFSKLFIAIAILPTILACGLGSAGAPSTPTAETIPQNGFVLYRNVSLTIPKGLATNALVGTVPALTEGEGLAPWDVAPEHTKILLDHYAQGYSMHDAQIRVYPAQEYAELAIGDVGGQIRRVQALTSNAAPLTAENMPAIPFFNAGQTIAAQMQILQFKNGSGIRLVTQYNNGITPISDYGLFYHFQGLTSDGKYYVIAILPTSTDFLPPDETAYTIETPTVMDFPGFYKPDASFKDFTAYYQAITGALNSTSPDAFYPPLPQLDLLIQSLSITP